MNNLTYYICIVYLSWLFISIYLVTHIILVNAGYI